MNRGHLSSKNHEWGTPQAFFNACHAEFGFTLDAAASGDNHKLPRYNSKHFPYRFPWEGERVWCNPPYGREQRHFVIRALEETREKCLLAVLLVPARPDTAIWHDVIFPHADAIRWLRGRLTFEGAKDPAFFPSALVIFRGKNTVTRPLVQRRPGR